MILIIECFFGADKSIKLFILIKLVVTRPIWPNKQVTFLCVLVKCNSSSENKCQEPQAQHWSNAKSISICDGYIAKTHLVHATTLAQHSLNSMHLYHLSSKWLGFKLGSTQATAFKQQRPRSSTHLLQDFSWHDRRCFVTFWNVM